MKKEGFAVALVSALCAFSPAATAFEYSQFSPKGTKFAPPDTNRIAEIAARLPEKPGWYWRSWCSDAKAKSMLTGSVPELTEEGYMLFYSTGDRRRYESRLGLIMDMIASLSVKAANMEGSKLDRAVVMKRLGCIGVRPLRRGIGSADVEGAHPAGVATVDKGGSRHGRRGGAMMRRAGDAD